MFRTNVIYGLLVLVPAAIIFLLLVKIVEILENMAAPLNLESSTNVVVAILLGLLLLLLLCFVVGAFVRTQIGSWSLERLERKILNQIPGYEIISNMLEVSPKKELHLPRQWCGYMVR